MRYTSSFRGFSKIIPKKEKKKKKKKKEFYSTHLCQRGFWLTKTGL